MSMYRVMGKFLLLLFFVLLGTFYAKPAYAAVTVYQPTANEDNDTKNEVGELLTIPGDGCPTGSNRAQFVFYYDTILRRDNVIDAQVDANGRAEFQSRFNPYETWDFGHNPYEVYLELRCFNGSTETARSERFNITLVENDDESKDPDSLNYPTEKPPPPPACANDAIVDGKCTKVDTAVGILCTEADCFVKSIFAMLLSLSGGVAILIIMYAGYLYMASRGSPEMLQRAREMIVSAIVGLLFIVFSFVIMEIITGDILRLPGFSYGY